MTPSFSGSEWWGELNLEKSGCAGDEQKSVKRGEKGCNRVTIQKCNIPNVEEASKPTLGVTMMPLVSQSFFFDGEHTMLGL